MSETVNPVIERFGRGSKGLQHYGLRRTNERAVLTVVGFNPGVSNAEISRICGLAPQTVSAILLDLEAAGLISRGEVLRGRRGQPATPISLDAQGAYSIGLEVGWRHAELIIINFHAQVVGRFRLDYEEADLQHLAGQLSERIAQLTQDWPDQQRARLGDIGLCLPGTVHSALEPLSARAGSKPGPSQADFAAELERRTGLAVTIFNDGNAACWAELISRPSPRPENFIYLLVSTYLAAGLVADGRLLQGATGHSADLGAMFVATESSGSVPAHAIASATALVEQIKARGVEADFGSIGDWDWPRLEPVVASWIEDCARALALVVYNANAVIETGLVVIDSIFPPAITERLTQRLAEQSASLPSPHPIEIVSGHLGRSAPALGAAELALYQRYLSRELLEKSQISARD